MEISSSSNQPPHFPPGGEAIKVTGVIRNQTKPKSVRRKGKQPENKNEIDASMGDNKPPPAPPPPPMPIFKPPREKTPMRGRPRASTVKATSSTETGAEIKTRRGRSRSAAKGEEEVKIKPAPTPMKIDVTPKRANTEGLPTDIKKQRAQSEPAKPRGRPKAMAKATKPILKSIPEGKYAPEPPEKHRKTEPIPEPKKETTTPIKIKVIKKAELAKVKPTRDFIPPSRASVKNVVETLKNRMKDSGFSKTDSSAVIEMMKEYTDGASKERKKQIDGEFKKLYSKYYKALRT